MDRVVDIAVAAHNHLENVAKLTRDNSKNLNKRISDIAGTLLV